MPRKTIARISCIFFIECLILFKAHAQTILLQGDVSLIGFNANATPKNYAFVVWKTVQIGTVIKITDNAFNGPGLTSTSTNGYRNSEQTAVWTANAELAPGSVISISGNTANTGTVQTYNANGATTTTILLGTSTGDQLFIFQGNTPASGAAVTFTGTLLFGMGYQSTSGEAGWLSSGATASNTSYRPTDLKDSNHVYVLGNANGGQYNGDRTGMTIAQYRAAIADYTKWTLATAGTVPLSSTSFGVGSALPLNLLSFSASSQNGKAKLQWKTAMEENVKGFYIETSADASRFETIGFVNAKNQLNYEQLYAYEFTLPVAQQVSFCRLRMVDMDGTTTYSKTVKLEAERSAVAAFGLYPNYIERGQSEINLKRMQPLPAGIKAVNVKVLSGDGRVIKQQMITDASSSTSWKINTGVTGTGRYLVQISDANGKWTESISFMVR
ncbi:hypothetical protein LZZ85_16770 [Terrimonas sp. NA20]|uniref:T9SS type A sorting domain-containing protein n=1 Tax=Terrimonas ginsenosidimutans TaxID=2908004 RepID=A0ABS9KUD1_9BACT|nr:hypothetical protein [Terrimonas ginsenosidimutans]MCG2615952.1 hypothetical protein [Terrimonas ginsenosidimutans]